MIGAYTNYSLLGQLIGTGVLMIIIAISAAVLVGMVWGNAR